MNGFPLLPEAYFFLCALFFLALSMLPRWAAGPIHKSALLLAAGGAAVSLAALNGQGLFFSGTLGLNFFSQFFKLLLTLGVFCVVLLCRELKGLREERHPEFYFLLFLGTLAMMVLVSSIELLTLYVSLELTSYGLYLMVPLREGKDSHLEGGLKYFLFGAASSAVMLFGLALLYGGTGTTDLIRLKVVLPPLMSSPTVFLGFFFSLAGLFFKLAFFPFHLWAPGVYQGAANQVVAYIATVTKVAALAVLIRFFSVTGGSPTLAHILALLAIASMTIGNLAAVVQKDLKRLLAYSAVAQAGYAMIGLLTMTEKGYAGVIFYALAYLTMNLLVFLVVVRVATKGENLELDHLAGLHQRSPLLALALMLGVFSLGGLPPTIGFTGKFLIFLAAMEKGYFLLVLIGMINVVLSLYYYALIVKAAFFQKPAENLPPVSLSLPDRLLAAALLLMTIYGGLFPGYFYELARSGARLLLRWPA
jgi:NADH-quinone oxidoreductase subunit N